MSAKVAGDMMGNGRKNKRQNQVVRNGFCFFCRVTVGSQDPTVLDIALPYRGHNHPNVPAVNNA